MPAHLGQYFFLGSSFEGYKRADKRTDAVEDWAVATWKPATVKSSENAEERIVSLFREDEELFTDVGEGVSGVV